MVKKIAMASVSILSLTLGTAALAQQGGTAAAPQAAQASEEGGPNNDIIITATKIATNVQDTPIAITAVTSETLATRQITNAADIGNVVPNARFRKAEGIYGPAVTASLRGIGQADPNLAGEPAVAFYIDDVYYPLLFGSQFDLLDIDHVEVLRGPQGTLFGRNSEAGAVNLVSKKPSLTETSAYVDVTVGQYNRRDLRAGFSVPLTDTLAISVAMASKKRRGYQEMVDFSCQMFKNGTPELAGSFPFQTPATSFVGGRVPGSCTFDYLGGEDTQGVRGAVRWQPADNVELNITADYTDQNDEIPAEKIFRTNYAETYGLQPNGTVDESKANKNFITMADQFTIPGKTPFRWDKRFEINDIFKTYDNYCDPFPAGYKITGNTYYTGSIFRGGKCYGNTVPLKNRGIQGKLVVGLTDQIDFTVIAGWRKMDQHFGAASDGTVLNDSIIYHEVHEKHWTGEARLTGQFSFADVVAGVFYYEGDAEHLGQPQGVRAGTQRYQRVLYSPLSKAAYLNVNVRPFDRLTVNGGIRYSDDAKGVDFSSLNDGTKQGSNVFVSDGVDTFFKTTIATKRWDWKAGLNYEPWDRTMLYVSAGSGYRLPGYQARPSQPGQEGQLPGENIISYEAGIKADFFDRRLRINAAVYAITFTERPASYSGQEAQYAVDPVTKQLIGKVAGNSTVIPGGPAGTDQATAFTTCRAYNAATDGPRDPSKGGALNTHEGVGVACVARPYSYAIGGHAKGAELEVTLTPIDNLSIDYSFGYNKFAAQAGSTARNLPGVNMSGGIQYKAEVPALKGSITPRLDWFWEAKTVNDSNRPQYDTPARSVFNGRITYANTDLNFDVSVGATNLFNKIYYQNVTIFEGLGLPTNLGQPAAPRQWYLSFKKRF
ncbi:TonB-dependent receptor [Sphingobium nicotianae]|uniref:TonB-dependent receptor n=1 Tax=Sphingobium nicotianae TaxID=2782607 RepID=A0A9X1DDL3_9SPHN|nr:TonB-dependent receptor [Sphingobium nicotianae]MBT2188222.1 TonB-dependent receptor [Sphingobium nicotianae]